MQLGVDRSRHVTGTIPQPFRYNLSKGENKKGVSIQSLLSFAKCSWTYATYVKLGLLNPESLFKCQSSEETDEGHFSLN